MSNQDTNFKENDPKRGHSNPDNPKDRGKNYEGGKDHDSKHGHKDKNKDKNKDKKKERGTADRADKNEQQKRDSSRN